MPLQWPYRRADSDSIAVSFQRVCVTRRRVPILRALDFEVARGSMVGVFGPSGCGKSTLVQSILGVQRGVQGHVTVLGHPAGSAYLKSRVAAVPQAPSVYDELSVEWNLAYFARIVGAERGAIDRALEAVDLSGHRARLVGRLSGGQRNRVSLAIALLGQPQLLLLDEPTVGLDPLLRADLWEVFHRLVELGTTIVVTSHSMDEALHCDEVAVMREGSLLACAHPSQLMQQTASATVEQAFVKIVKSSAAELHGLVTA